MKKPNILVPLPASKSRGDQLLNAQLFASHGYSVVVEDEKLPSTDLSALVDRVYRQRAVYIDEMKKAAVPDGVEAVMQLISEYANAAGV
jgi:UDP-N-acetylglucosamine--N-acetylmuramyl-(pentapeptide) pyrophosphoryl-undecaprenol N-acetylglucosamine transferase